MGVPPNGWFLMENTIKLDDLGYPHLWQRSNVSTMSPPCFREVQIETSQADDEKKEVKQVILFDLGSAHGIRAG